jgi:hypothetical protein
MKRRFTRKELGAELRARGFPISDSKLNKMAAPSVNQGPPVDAWLGRRPLYELAPCIAWAESLLRSERSSLQPQSPKQDAPTKARRTAMEVGLEEDGAS